MYLNSKRVKVRLEYHCVVANWTGIQLESHKDRPHLASVSYAAFLPRSLFTPTMREHRCTTALLATCSHPCSAAAMLPITP